jgi:hypothetical protein
MSLLLQCLQAYCSNVYQPACSALKIFPITVLLSLHVGSQNCILKKYLS